MERIIPDRVLKRRTDLDLTQKQLAERISSLGFGQMHYQSIQQLEDGDVKKPSYAKYLAEALETTWEYLTGKTDNPAAPNGTFAKETLGSSVSNGHASQQFGIGQEGAPYMLTEISRMLGVMEGSMKTAFNARFDTIDAKLNDHEKRLEALEDRPHPQKGRRR